jgi:hypothetical protein
MSLAKVRRRSSNQENNMPLEITCKDNHGISVLSLVGRLTFGNDVLVFRMVFDGLMDERHVRMAFNLSRLSEIDITGVNTLLYASGEGRRRLGHIRIEGVFARAASGGKTRRLESIRNWAGCNLQLRPTRRSQTLRRLGVSSIGEGGTRTIASIVTRLSLFLLRNSFGRTRAHLETNGLQQTKTGEEEL